MWVRAPVDKHKDLPAGRLSSQFTANQSAKSLEGLAHVAMSPVQVIVQRVAQGEHRLPQMNELGNTARIARIHADTNPIGEDNLSKTGIFRVKWNKSTGNLLVSFAILAHPVLEGG